MPDYSVVGAVFPLVAYPIIGVDTGTEEFVIDGDQTARILVDDVLEVVDSTGNDGTYTVASTSYAAGPDETTITVNENITDATIDGKILHDEIADEAPITESHDDAADRDAAEPDQIAGAHIERLANEVRAVEKTVNIALGFEVVDAGGLAVYHTSGILNTAAGAPSEHAPGKLTLPDNDDSYVEVDSGGITSNITGFTAGKFPLAIVTTLAGAVTRIQDKRAALGGGGSGGVPAPSVDNRLVRTNGVNGEIQQAVGAILSDDDDMYALRRVGIGPDADPALYPLHIQDDTVDTIAAYTIARLSAIKTAGITDQSDTFVGEYPSLEMNQNGGTIGYMWPLLVEATLTDGEVGAGGSLREMGASLNSYVDGGKLWGDQYAVNAYLENTGGEVTGDVSAFYAFFSNAATTGGDGIIAKLEGDGTEDYCIKQIGSGDNYFGGNIGIGPNADPPLYPLHIQDDTLDFIATHEAMQVYETKTAGASDQNDHYIGADLFFVMDQAGGTIGYFWPLIVDATLNDGSIGASGNDREMGTSLNSFVNGGKVWGTQYAVNAYLENSGGEVTGDVSAIYAYFSNAATTGGDGIIAKLEGDGTEDYCIKQLGNADNYLGGALEVVGITTMTGGRSCGPPSELTISGAVVTVTGPYHTIDGEGDLSDNLDTINGMVDGEIVVFRAENTARVITLRDGIDNLDLGANIVLDNVRKTVALIYDSTLGKVLRYNGA